MPFVLLFGLLFWLTLALLAWLLLYAYGERERQHDLDAPSP